MKFILEYKKFFKEGDIVQIEYWYNHMVTPVKILEIPNGKNRRRGYLVSHNVDGSKIKNAPDELIPKKYILSIFRKETHLS